MNHVVEVLAPKRQGLFEGTTTATPHTITHIIAFSPRSSVGVDDLYGLIAVAIAP